MITSLNPVRRWSLLAGAILAALDLVTLTEAQVNNSNAPPNLPKPEPSLVTNNIPSNPPPAVPPPSRGASGDNSSVSGIGRPVIGRILFPPPFRPIGEQSNFLMITLSRPRRLTHPDDVGTFMEPDGTFRIENVPAGTWGFLGMFYTNNEIFYFTAGKAIVVPEMPGGRSDEPLDMGRLDVVLVTGHPLQIGEPAPLFEVETTDGGSFKLADHRGQFVLLDFEQVHGSYQERDSVEAALALSGTNNRLAALTFIGPTGGTFIGTADGDRRAFPWSKTDLGKLPYYAQYPLLASFGFDMHAGRSHPATTIPGLTPLGSLPGVLLVGPDGKIIAKDLHGDAIKAAVAEALGSLVR